MLWVWTILRLLLWFSWSIWSFLHWMLNHFNLYLALWLEIWAPPNSRDKNGARVQSTCKLSWLESRVQGALFPFWIFNSCYVLSCFWQGGNFVYEAFTKHGCPGISQLMCDTKILERFWSDELYSVQCILVYNTLFGKRRNLKKTSVWPSAQMKEKQGMLE